jgi:hypothetical protein
MPALSRSMVMATKSATGRPGPLCKPGTSDLKHPWSVGSRSLDTT